MSLLPPIEIESELSYAYLHAVSAQARMSCEIAGRHSDKMGVDAIIRSSEKFAKDSLLTDLALDVQLKATINESPRRDGKISYFFNGVDRYDKLRIATVNPPRILVVLFLPKEPTKWLKCTDEELSLRKCDWWVSLRNAPPSDNHTGQTVYLPEKQLFNPDGLRDIMTLLSKEEDLNYAG